MLKPEEARERLKRFGREDVLYRLAWLAPVAPEVVRQAAHLFAGSGTEAAGRRLDFLPPAGRAAVFRPIFPRSAAHVERAWQLGLTPPYPVGHDRHAFRAPGATRLTARVRAQRLQTWRGTEIRR
jgi:hypothetical protein